MEDVDETIRFDKGYARKDRYRESQVRLDWVRKGRYVTGKAKAG